MTTTTTALITPPRCLRSGFLPAGTEDGTRDGLTPFATPAQRRALDQPGHATQVLLRATIAA